MTNKETKPKYVIWLYFFGFILLWEWLRPLGTLTDTGYLPVFLFYLVISLVMSYYGVRSLIRIGIKALYIFYTLNFIYLEGSFFTFSWIFTVIEEISANMQFVFQGSWVSLSDFFRSLLFFILLTLMTYLLQYWLVYRKNIFLFFFLTLLYVTVLDTFTAYDGKYAIIRTVIAGFTLMGVLTFFRLMEKENLIGRGISLKSWLVPLIWMISFGVIIGYTSPKASPLWPDPVPYIKSYANKSMNGGGAVRKVGYGADDSRLGGPFVGDDTPVYEVETGTRQYWKVETKDIYTGKGWVASHPDSQFLHFYTDTEYPILTYFPQYEENLREETSIVRPLYDYPHLIYPLGLKFMDNDLGYSYLVDVNLEKIFYNKTSNETIREYTVTHEVPRFSVSKLMEVTDISSNSISDEAYNHYTQLPDTLPSRVKDLAVEITKDYDNWYDKAKAIEKYFASVEYQYSQTDVAIPSADEDYVDQFLFETKKGYCDNFSTSMVVLLRSIGIPSRWVKGYTDGSFKGITNEGKRQYVITNNHAHSWVEVFFPNVGWVPFEPTKGFTNSAQFTFDNLELDVNEETEQTPVERNEQQLESGEREQTSSPQSLTWKDYVEKVKDFFVERWKFFMYGFLLITLISFILYRTRLKWFPRLLIFRYLWKSGDEHFPTAYLSLLKQLERYGLPRTPDQTLSDYAKKIDRFFATDEMGELTRSYEKYLYKGTLEEGTWRKKKEMWENLIKKMIA